MNKMIKLALLGVVATALYGCDGDTDVIEIEKDVIVENTVTVIEQVEVPVIVPVPQGTGTDIQVGTRPYFLVDDFISFIKRGLEKDLTMSQMD